MKKEEKKSAEINSEVLLSYRDKTVDTFKASPEQHKAIDKYVKILQKKPNDAQASFFLGFLLFQVNKTEEAKHLVSQAIALGLENHDVYRTLGAIYQSLEAFEKSSICEKKAITFNPEYVDGHYNIGCNHLKLGNSVKAIESFQQVVAMQPDHYEAHNNLGLAYFNEKLFKNSIDSYNNALEIKPDFPLSYLGKGNTLREIGQTEDAVGSFQKAITIDPNFTDAHNNLGNVRKDLGLYEDALKSLNTAYSLAPTNATVRKNIGIINLLMGNFKIGWEEYSWRRFENNSELTERIYSQPLWNGEDLNGKTIFVYSEQGFGDTIQFVRYLDLLKKQGGLVVLDAQHSLASLLEEMESINILLKKDELPPPFDFHVPLMELPRIYSTNATNIPSANGYLTANKMLVEAWRTRLGQKEEFRIGIVWAGSSTRLDDHNRSMSLEYLKPLFDVEGCTFFSLQFGERCQDITSAGYEHTLKNLEQDIIGFMEPAAAITNMDLVISVDTAIVHLAGALGKPVWTLLQFDSDWRWMLNRNDSPWYSFMKLFRQEKRQDWKGVIERVKNELMELVK
jgi:tetratricopeptide (TPR) repeat protein